jgi:hypothetical protein
MSSDIDDSDGNNGNGNGASHRNRQRRGHIRLDSNDHNETSLTGHLTQSSHHHTHNSINNNDNTSLWHSLWTGQLLAMAYIWAEARRSPRSVAIGTFTVFLVVAVARYTNDITIINYNHNHNNHDTYNFI